ncbi:holo-[acyl-carrier-protein] synthase [Phytophthora pseudosyringae]|uniref:Holo-[acyl-carrier-protein] synthase n=1 Tax=Phytophthora pseudosyringae TaxID=221518 RepID=A0A8T1VMW7_9STRA|nr:holo-[acyl-carrier-protein] synthase [Phytophthora pseudosyringae]
MNYPCILLGLAACAVGIESTAATDATSLPVIFFHGLSDDYTAGDNFVANLTAEGRTGGAISRAVVEEMDDHQVQRYISLAGLQNGVFSGPNDADALATAGRSSVNYIVPEAVLNLSTYTSEDAHGKVQHDIAQLMLENPDLQYEYSYFNLQRSLQFGSWSYSNFFLSVLNNVNPCLPGDDQCIYDQRRRKANFLKLESAYFFTSPEDGTITPWQSSHFGRYSEVNSVAEIETNFKDLTVVDMKDTLEYTSDTFGLRTLDERGGLFLVTADNVTHVCWSRDSAGCWFQDVYDTYIYPVLLYLDCVSGRQIDHYQGCSCSQFCHDITKN